MFTDSQIPEGLNSLSRSTLQTFMSTAGYKTNYVGEDSGDAVQAEAADGSWLYHMNVIAAFQYMEFALKLPKGSVKLVNPELLKSFMEVCLKGVDAEASAEVIQGILDVQAKRKAALEQILNEKAVVLVPVHHLQHWALLVVQNTHEGHRNMYWRDSLKVEPGGTAEAMKTYIEVAMKETLDMEFVATEVNKAKQPEGSAVCGCFVLHWMEQACRKLVLNEAGCSIGWPTSEAWAAKMLKLVEMMQKEQTKLQIDADALAAKTAKAAAKKKAAKDAAVAADMKKGMLKDLKAEAEASLSKIPAGKPCFENLSAASKAAVLKASAMPGICSRCRWTSGCLNCDKEKALKYYLKQEGFVEDHMEYKAPQ